MSDSRERILNRVKKAVNIKPSYEPVDPEAIKIVNGGQAEVDENDKELLLKEFLNRFEFVGGMADIASSPEEFHTLLHNILAPYQGEKAALTPGFLDQITPGIRQTVSNAGLDVCTPEPDSAADARIGITAGRMALAYSGTIIVSAVEPGELSASLLPPIHIAVIPVDKLVHGVGRALDHFSAQEQSRATVMITGPSRTADIELQLVKGVHGPEVVHAVFLNYDD